MQWGENNLSGRWHGGEITLGGHCSNMYFDGMPVCGYLGGYDAQPSPCSAEAIVTYVCFCYYFFLVWRCQFYSYDRASNFARDKPATGVLESIPSVQLAKGTVQFASLNIRRLKACTMKPPYQSAERWMHSTVLPERMAWLRKQKHPARVMY